MKKTIIKLLAIIGAIAAIAVVIYIFRDKIAEFLSNAKCKCRKCRANVEDAFDDLKGAVEDLEDDLEDDAEDAVQSAADAVADAAQTLEDKAAAIAEEFKDYADVE